MPNPTDKLEARIEAAIAACEESACSQFGASGDALNAVYSAARAAATEVAKLREALERIRDGELVETEGGKKDGFLSAECCRQLARTALSQSPTSEGETDA